VPVLALIVFDERLSLVGTLGIGLVVAGIARLHLAPGRAADTPARLGHGLLWPILTGVTIAGYSLVDKARRGAHQPGAVHHADGARLRAAGPAAALGSFGGRAERAARLAPIVLAGVMSTLAYTLVLFAFRMSKTGYVVAARELSIVLSALIGSLWLREGGWAPRLAGAPSCWRAWRASPSPDDATARAG
jgi:drug/metabolite transporter (DMT)-like permease